MPRIVRGWRNSLKFGDRPLRLHCTRHTWASLASASGKSVRWVAEPLGDADPAVAHVIPDAETDPSFLNFDGPRGPRIFLHPSTKPPRSEVTEVTQESGAPRLTRTCDLQVRNMKPTQEVTRGYVSCLARACEERHQAATATAPSSIRLQHFARPELLQTRQGDPHPPPLPGPARASPLRLRPAARNSVSR